MLGELPLDIGEDVRERTIEIGGAVYAHYFFQKMSGLPLPSPAIPVEVLDVCHTIMNHTGIEPDQLASSIPLVQAMMDQCKTTFSAVSD